jgi:hypothetical protein
MIRHNKLEMSYSKPWYCGDSYCSGHIDSFAECECGWKVKVGDNKEGEKLHLLHRVEELEHLMEYVQELKDES